MNKNFNKIFVFTKIILFKVLYLVFLNVLMAEEINYEAIVYLEPLPYSLNALEPYISSKTLEFHHGKHHANYVKNAVELLKKHKIASAPVEDIIKQIYSNPTYTDLYNNLAQAWNHAFFWKCLKPNGGGKPSGKLLELIEKYFENYEKFVDTFINAGKKQFGSGWVWLVKDNDHLKILSTSNADTPIAYGMKPLFVVDVWEHAYYLDYQHQRAEFIKIIIEKLANWEFVNSLLDK